MNPSFHPYSKKEMYLQTAQLLNFLCLHGGTRKLAMGCNPTIDMSCYWETTAFIYFCLFIDSLKFVPVLGELDKLYALSFMVALELCLDCVPNLTER